MRLASLADIAAHRRALGDSVDAGAERLICVGKLGARFSTIELRWQAATASVHLFEVLPLDVPPHALTAVAAAVMTANAQLGIPGFQLRQSPAGWRVVFLAYAFLDEDGAISARVLDELVRAVRVNAGAYLPQFATRIGEASRPVEAQQLGRFGRTNPQLAEAELAALRAAIERAAPAFAPRLATARFTELVQPFLARSAIFEVSSALPAPRILYAARDAAGGMHVVSGQLAELRAVCALDPPVLATADAALVFANLVAVWTADELGELRIAAFDDIPWRADAPAARIAELRAAHAGRIAAPVLEPIEDGYELRYWSVANSRLVRRRIAVTRTGELASETEVIASVPVAPGRTWGLRDGRLVPVE